MSLYYTNAFLIKSDRKNVDYFLDKANRIMAKITETVRPYQVNYV